ncbi:hypothetical protein M5K25_016778 [Dendrobium thyrsiflorum]|uniref:Uncharacterized protein n=1 Tax=Dendrobium thyrsiflorum TaxID=117978 RepID=A0ABD0USF3_DENTH
MAESKTFGLARKSDSLVCVGKYVKCVLRVKCKEMGTDVKAEKCEWQAHELEPNSRPLKHRFVFWYTRRTKVHPPPPLPALEATLGVPPPKPQDVLFYSKVHGPVKRRKVSAIRQFPPGCGPVSGAATSACFPIASSEKQPTTSCSAVPAHRLKISTPNFGFPAIWKSGTIAQEDQLAVHQAPPSSLSEIPWRSLPHAVPREPPAVRTFTRPQTVNAHVNGALLRIRSKASSEKQPTTSCSAVPAHRLKISTPNFGFPAIWKSGTIAQEDQLAVHQAPPSSLSEIPWRSLPHAVPREPPAVRTFTRPQTVNAHVNGALLRIRSKDINKRYHDKVWIGTENLGYIQAVIMEDLPSYCVHCKSLAYSQAECCILHPHLKPSPGLKPLSNIGGGNPITGVEESMLGIGCDLVERNIMEVGAVGNELISHPLNVSDIEPLSVPDVLTPMVPVEAVHALVYENFGDPAVNISNTQCVHLVVNVAYYLQWMVGAFLLGGCKKFQVRMASLPYSPIFLFWCLLVYNC